MMRLDNLPPDTEMGIRITHVTSAYELYIADSKGKAIKKIMGAGIVGKNKTNSIPQYLENIGKFKTSADATNSYYVIVQVSNFHWIHGGLFYTPIIGEASYIEKSHMLDIFKIIFVSGVIFLAGIFNINLYLQRRSDIGSLWLSLFCFTLALTILLNSRYLYYFNSTTPNLNKHASFIGQIYIFGIILLPMYGEFFHAQFPKVLKRKYVNTIWIFYFHTQDAIHQ